jgi:hypothetical protein
MCLHTVFSFEAVTQNNYGWVQVHSISTMLTTKDCGSAATPSRDRAAHPLRARTPSAAGGRRGRLRAQEGAREAGVRTEGRRARMAAAKPRALLCGECGPAPA